jgi:acyl-coenzyme A synthetase/AMP-(fatty) acid ligase
VRIPGNEETFYRTGDLVRQDKTGNLHFMGRKDRQIKTRGYRVELDEVEAALVALEAVEEAAVFAVPNELEGLLIEAAVILKKDATATELTLRNEIGASLPSYAVPYRIHIFDELPRTSSGKINRLHLQQYVSKISHT